MLIAEFIFDLVRIIIQDFQVRLLDIVLVFDRFIMQVVPAEYPGIVSLLPEMLPNRTNGIAPLETFRKVTQDVLLFFCFVGIQVEVVVVV